ncbi:hypothetical protein RchiOBHm_Chr7g0225951 [Rosa chinensis]|uniref:Uncharacterized protein n=1 Tax=Rosa chinensis TaxID=74649 RepID=A0A2P6PE91_ROSCH|nr:hypothetical protein RchiOBHm_Chr7g0225951 [Rosa chinensis]
MRREKGPSFLLCSRSLHRLQASFHFRFCSRIQTRRETELSSVSIKLSDIKVAGVAERRGEIQDFLPSFGFVIAVAKRRGGIEDCGRLPEEG